MKDNQLQMLKALEATFCNITDAAKMASINPKTHHEWCKKSNDYKNAWDELIGSRVNIAESQLHKNISEGKETSLIFFLKCKGGYTERTETKGTEVRKWLRS